VSPLPDNRKDDRRNTDRRKGERRKKLIYAFLAHVGNTSYSEAEIDDFLDAVLLHPKTDTGDHHD